MPCDPKQPTGKEVCATREYLQVAVPLAKTACRLARELGPAQLHRYRAMLTELESVPLNSVVEHTRALIHIFETLEGLAQEDELQGQ